MHKRRINIITLLLIAVIAASADLYSADELKDQIDKINQVIRAASGTHIDNVESKKLVDAAIRGLLKELDPYSYYFTADELEDISNRRTGSYYGVGFNPVWINDTLQIISVASNSPADISGIKLGDKILRINGKKIIGQDKKSVEKMFKGDKNEIMTFDIFKAKEQELKSFRLKKVKLPLTSVDASYIVEGTKIGYIAVNRFMNSTYYEVLDSLMNLNERGMESLIIDFRGNPGGLIDQTYMVADEFIAEGDDIIITRGKDPKFNFRYKSSPSGKFEKLPVVVLVDSSTISAPEIFAGAIQDLDRGIIVGKTSYGKGVVQNPIKLSDGSELWLTVAKYFTPSGRNVHKDTVIKNKPTNRLEERIIIKDGMNFAYNAEVHAEAGNDSVPIYASKSGRPIYGGGGITPDYYVEESSFSDFTQKLVDKNVLLKVALDYAVANGDSLLNHYGKDYPAFYHNFNFDASIDQNLMHFALTNNLEWDESKFKRDKDLIYVSVKSILAGMIWSNNEKYQIINTASSQLKKAIEIMPVAEKIINPVKQ
jgi:carboxyl-terminal processing protease